MSKTAKYAVGVGILVVVFAVVYYFASGREGGPPTKVTRTTITLVQTGQGAPCGVPGNVGRIVAKNRDAVVFHVINNCEDDYTVRLGNFRPNGTGSPNDNVLTGSRMQTVPRHGSADIQGNVDTLGAAGTVTYKYDIFIRKGSDPETLAKDPEYEIWP